MSAVTDPLALGDVLAVFAHPDDEAYLAGGIMAACADAGRRVVCVTATRGELGTSDPETWPPERLGAVREAELKACLDLLGVTEHHWLGAADGGCAGADPKPLVAKLAALVDEVRPDTVLTFGPDGMTWHPDHIAVGAWTTEAVRRAATGARLHYATNTPDFNDFMSRYIDLDVVMMADRPPPATELEDLSIHVVLTGEALERKLAALRCQVSQVAPLVELFGEEAYERVALEEAYAPA